MSIVQGPFKAIRQESPPSSTFVLFRASTDDMWPTGIRKQSALSGLLSQILISSKATMQLNMTDV